MPHNSARKILYIAGKVTGIENLNREAFDRAAEQLEAAGENISNHGHQG